MLRPTPVSRAFKAAPDKHKRMLQKKARRSWNVLAKLRALSDDVGHKSDEAAASRCSSGQNLGDPRGYGTFRLNFHRFDRFELDLRGHTQP